MSSTLMDWLFDPSGLTPHGFCLLWQPGLIWTHALSDIAIGLAYGSIPLALAVLVRRRRDLMFRPLFWLFAAFILLCGASHWMDVLTLFVPAYGLQAVVKVATAVVSLVTAVMLWRYMPQVLTLPSPAQLREANEALRDSQERLHHAEKMEAVGQLTGGIAHDFNNMLQIVQGGVNMIERALTRGRGEEAGRYIQVTYDALDRAASLTHRLLAFSRRQALRPAPVEPDMLVHGMRDLIARTLGPAIRLELSLHDGVWKILCDAHQLENALLNLAINARDAMPGGGTLTIATADRALTAAGVADQAEARPGDYVQIAVTDTGTGMDAAVLARVFEPFFTTKPPGQGTGLGLSQVHGFVHQSGGFVRLDSAPGRGTTIWLHLPRHDEAAPEAAEIPAQAARATHATGQADGEVILVVEDEDAIRAQIAQALREAGFSVIEAEDGPSGLRVARSGADLALLVTDVGLPGLSGRALADAARDRLPGLPVLFISGYAGTALDNLPLDPRMEIMRKPFSVDELVARARAMLRVPAAR